MPVVITRFRPVPFSSFAGKRSKGMMANFLLSTVGGLGVHHRSRKSPASGGRIGSTVCGGRSKSHLSLHLSLFSNHLCRHRCSTNRSSTQPNLPDVIPAHLSNNHTASPGHRTLMRVNWLILHVIYPLANVYTAGKYTIFSSFSSWPNWWPSPSLICFSYFFILSQ